MFVTIDDENCLNLDHVSRIMMHETDEGYVLRFQDAQGNRIIETNFLGDNAASDVRTFLQKLPGNPQFAPGMPEISVAIKGV